MPGDIGLLHKEVAQAPLLEKVYVRTANAVGHDPYDRFPRQRYGDFLLRKRKPVSRVQIKAPVFQWYRLLILAGRELAPLPFLMLRMTWEVALRLSFSTLGAA
jgi:hypothetical protein